MRALYTTETVLLAVSMALHCLVSFLPYCEVLVCLMSRVGADHLMTLTGLLYSSAV